MMSHPNEPREPRIIEKVAPTTADALLRHAAAIDNLANALTALAEAWNRDVNLRLYRG